MNYKIILTIYIFIFFKTDITAMKRDFKNSFSSCNSLILHKHLPEESERIQQMRIDKNEFEKKFEFKQQSYIKYLADNFNATQQLATMIFRAFYHQNGAIINYVHYMTDLNFVEAAAKTNNDTNLFYKLNKCKNIHINGYSFLGATVLAKNVPNENKYLLIQKLKDHDFLPTEKDRELLQLYLYDKILAEQKSTMTFLLSDNHNNLSVLPYDIKREIMQKLMNLEKITY